MLYVIVRKVVSSKDGDGDHVDVSQIALALYTYIDVANGSHVHIRVVLATLSMHARFVRPPKGGKSRPKRKYHSGILLVKPIKSK